MQLQSRQHLGLLEKHKDYVLRARDYEKKRLQLKRLHEKVLVTELKCFFTRFTLQCNMSTGSQQKS